MTADATLRAKIQLDDSGVRKVTPAFNQATASARQFEAQVQKGNAALTTMSARAQMAAQTAGRIRGGIGQVGYAAMALAGSSGNQTIQGAIQGASTGAILGSPFGPIGSGIGAAVGGIAGGVQGYFAGEKAEKEAAAEKMAQAAEKAAEEQKRNTAAQERLTQELAGLMMQIVELTTAQKSATTREDQEALRKAIVLLSEESRKLVNEGASRSDADRIMRAEITLESAERIGARIEKAVAPIGARGQAERQAMRQRSSNGNARGGG